MTGNKKSAKVLTSSQCGQEVLWHCKFFVLCRWTQIYYKAFFVLRLAIFLTFFSEECVWVYSYSIPFFLLGRAIKRNVNSAVRLRQ